MSVAGAFLYILIVSGSISNNVCRTCSASLFIMLPLFLSSILWQEDKKKKESIEAKNKADSLVYETEKALKEHSDKISGEEKATIEEKLEALKKTLEADNTEEINKATEELTNAFHVLAQKMYQDAGAQAGEANPGEQAEEPKDDNVVDADYEVVDDDK